MLGGPHLFIAVSYRSVADVAGFLESLTSQSSDNWKLIVKDNSQDDDEAAAIRKVLEGMPAASLHSSSENSGYFPGAQEVLSGEDWRDYRSITVCNVDLELGSYDFLTRMDSLDSLAPEVMVVAPDILAVNKKVRQNPFMIKRPTALSAVRRRLMFASAGTAAITLKVYPRWVQAKRILRLQESVVDIEQSGPCREIYAPHGAFVTFRPSYFAAGNNFRHPIVLFGEELTVGENVRASGGAVLYCPSLKVVHRENSSIGANHSRFILDAFVESGKYGLSLYGRR